MLSELLLRPVEIPDEGLQGLQLPEEVLGCSRAIAERHTDMSDVKSKGSWFTDPHSHRAVMGMQRARMAQ